MCIFHVSLNDCHLISQGLDSEWLEKTLNKIWQVKFRAPEHILRICISINSHIQQKYKQEKIKLKVMFLTMSPCSSLSLLFHIFRGFASPPFQLGT